MLKLISFPVFLVSLAIGLLLVYLSEPEYKNVYIYPNPDNINKYQWMDNAKNCYEWQQSLGSLMIILGNGLFPEIFIMIVSRVIYPGKGKRFPSLNAGSTSTAMMPTPLIT